MKSMRRCQPSRVLYDQNHLSPLKLTSGIDELKQIVDSLRWNPTMGNELLNTKLPWRLLDFLALLFVL